MFVIYWKYIYIYIYIYIIYTYFLMGTKYFFNTKLPLLPSKIENWGLKKYRYLFFLNIPNFFEKETIKKYLIRNVLLCN